MITIELTPDNAELFKEFCRYQDQFQVLLSEGVFDEFIGSKIIHKDTSGIRMVETTFIKRLR